MSGGVDFEQEIIYNGIPAPQPETEGYTTNFNPPFELVEEYRVERSTFSAQFGLGQGALTYQMKSGTNSYHGDLFEINRNSFFDSVGFFNGPSFNSSNTRNVPPTDHENNYGFSPSVGRSGFLTSMTAVTRPSATTARNGTSRTTKTRIVRTVPTALEKTGNFTDFVGLDAAGNQVVIPIYDPTTGATGPMQRRAQRLFAPTASAQTLHCSFQISPTPTERAAASVG